MGTRTGKHNAVVPRADSLRRPGTVWASFGATVIAVGLSLGLVADLSPTRLLWHATVGVSALSVVVALWRMWLMLMARPASLETTGAPCPRYTVIVPLFREAHMVPQLVESLGRLNYPADRLDIVFACEAVDGPTCEAARAVTHPLFRTLVLPPAEPGGEPQTKPRALNHVLRRSHGELVTIYDAEDRPDPQQLRHAAAAFAQNPHWDALQAPLDYFNTGDGWLARQFGLEYAGLFHVLLPAFARLGLPFPLGGTSNHMRRSALEAVGGWDPFNVTEDADLAFRIAARGGGIGWIAPPTQEEACHRLRPWQKQRSRWLKGFMQTWLVHMKAPGAGGWRRALMLQLTIGLSLLSVAFFAPVMLALALWVLADLSGIVDGGLRPLFLGALGLSLCAGMAVGALGAVRVGKPHLLWSVPVMPLYWLLMFPPLLRAFRELRTDPYRWHKTEHGVTGARPELPQPDSRTWTPAKTSASP